MKTMLERNELFVTTLLVFAQQNEKFQGVIYDQMINSGCVETLAQVRVN